MGLSLFLGFNSREALENSIIFIYVCELNKIYNGKVVVCYRFLETKSSNFINASFCFIEKPIHG